MILLSILVADLIESMDIRLYYWFVWSERNIVQRCFVVEQKMIQISLLKIILSFGFMQKQKISVMNFAHQAAMEP